MFKFLKAKDPEFPREIKEHWYCGAWYLYLSDLESYKEKTLNPDYPRWAQYPAGSIAIKAAFNYFRTGAVTKSREDTSGLIDGLIPAIQIGDKVGLYRVTKGPYHTTSFYDGAPWDDGYHLDLQFVRAIPEVKALEILAITKPSKQELESCPKPQSTKTQST